MTTKEKIKQAVEESKAYPNPIIEYNFDEEVDIELFEGVTAIVNKQVARNSAKVIYKLT